MSYEREPVEATVAELRPNMKSLNITFKLVEKGEEREVTSRRDNETHRVLDAIAGDTSGIVTLSLWDDMIDTVELDKTYRLENGYTSLFQGHLRLNIGRYGELKEAENSIEDIDTENDLSAEEHERPPRRSYGGYGGGRSYGGGDRSYRRGGDSRRGGGRDRGRRRY
ncbi:MAG: single-stranded DNA-binding protein [Candidatus Hodarchaeota archaeon]